MGGDKLSKWDTLEEGTTHVFGFLVVDVYKSSDNTDAENQQISKFLDTFVTEMVEKRGGKKLNWALDGGKCAFLEKCDIMVNVAEDILIELNSKRSRANIRKFRIRITLHFGMAKWSKNTQSISGEDYTACRFYIF